MIECVYKILNHQYSQTIENSNSTGISYMNFNPNDKLSQLLYSIIVLNYITKYVNMFFFKNKYHIFIMMYLSLMMC